MKQWYESLFENYAKKYDQENFTQGTTGECDFIEREINCDRSVRILDIGCGTGRHSVELAKRGYKVVGIDLSDSQLERAEEKAAEQNVQPIFLRCDARKLPFEGEFELAIMLCEGAFPLMETDEMNFRILQNAAKALRPGGKFIQTTLNGLFPLFHSVKEFVNAASREGSPVQVTSTFDVMTFRDRNMIYFEDDLGRNKELQCDERYYVPSEITWLLKSAGFKSVEIFGAKLGAFSRADKLSVEDFEMLVIAELRGREPGAGAQKDRSGQQSDAIRQT